MGGWITAIVAIIALVVVTKRYLALRYGLIELKEVLRSRA